jgi:hypothetical protein
MFPPVLLGVLISRSSVTLYGSWLCEFGPGESRAAVAAGKPAGSHSAERLGTLHNPRRQTNVLNPPALMPCTSPGFSSPGVEFAERPPLIALSAGNGAANFGLQFKKLRLFRCAVRSRGRLLTVLMTERDDHTGAGPPFFGRSSARVSPPFQTAPHDTRENYAGSNHVLSCKVLDYCGRCDYEKPARSP